jgi:hypothetical protein
VSGSIGANKDDDNDEEYERDKEEKLKYPRSDNGLSVEHIQNVCYKWMIMLMMGIENWLHKFKLLAWI